MRIRPPIRRDSDAYLTIAMFALVALVLTLIMVNVRSLTLLKREIRLIEQRQLERLENQPTYLDTKSTPEGVNIP